MQPLSDVLRLTGWVATTAVLLTSGCGQREGVVSREARAPGTGASSPEGGAKVRAMAPFARGGFSLSGAEFWPYLGASEPRYPEDVLWGFYPEKGVVPEGETDPNPESASSAAVTCAERAYRELEAFLLHPPAELLEIARVGEPRGFTRRFYLWVNDYTRADDPFPPGVRPPRLWYWKRKVPDPSRPAGYWKWESTLTRRGECLTPSPEQIRRYLREALAELTAESTRTSP